MILDEFMPVWQFRERHTRRIAAPPARVFAAIKNVRANEILFFRTLTWIRRGGRKTPESILNAGENAPLKTTLAPGFALAAMNFLVTPDGKGGSLVSTETRVFASNASARKRFARYWRMIYPGSALIRRMWLRAVARRARA